MSDQPPHALEVKPDTAIQFTLTRENPTSGGSAPSDATPRCTMTLRHTGKTAEHLAFKVKTTQPRRYLVRPNQGVVAPNTTETVSILLVEKDKHILLQSYDRLGQSALDHSKDKFLVQSCSVSDTFASDYLEGKARGGDTDKSGKGLAEALTGMWNAAAAGGTVPIHNKKLQVRHVVAPGGDMSSAPGPGGRELKPTDKTSVEDMTKDQMLDEVMSLRRKYDELVSFSVNLTAERDILNNTLEQTKRDLNREMAARAAAERGGGIAEGTRQAPKSGGLGFSLIQILIVSFACFVAGVRMTKMGNVEFLDNIPYLTILLNGDEDASLVDAVGSGEK